MNCDSMCEQMDVAFDLGESLPEEVLRHLAACPKCAAHQQQLQALDAQLHLAPPVALDPALVARIQASIAAQPPQESITWPLAASIAAVMAFVLSAGWYVDAGRFLSGAAWVRWAPEGPLMPDWNLLRIELASAPASVIQASAQLLQWLSESWGNGSARLMAMFGENSAWIWLAFVVCLALAAALNASEAISHNGRRFRS